MKSSPCLAVVKHRQLIKLLFGDYHKSGGVSRSEYHSLETAAVGSDAQRCITAKARELRCYREAASILDLVAFTWKFPMAGEIMPLRFSVELHSGEFHKIIDTEARDRDDKRNAHDG